MSIHALRFGLYTTIFMSVMTLGYFTPDIINLWKTQPFFRFGCIAAFGGSIVTLGYALYENWESKDNDTDIRDRG